MNVGRIVVAIALLALGTRLLVAQQTGRPADTMMAQPGMARQQMQTMDSLNARLDTLVARMNRATGDAKVAAMAVVITELVAQRKAMQADMRQRMRSRPGMMRPMMRAPPPGAPAPVTDSTLTDSAAHEQHHPAE